MPFLDEIIERTEKEISAAKRDRSIGDLKRMIRDAPPLRPFGVALSNSFGIIAEVKRRSPSAGDMRAENFERAPAAYAKSPIVKAVSVLTNASDFGMGIDHLSRIKPLVRKPILRKDFIRKEYQVYEARAFGADAVLLMANVLSKSELKRMFCLARELEMDVLFEVHEREEIDIIPEGATIFGVNSRKFMATKRWRAAKLLLWLGVGKSSKAPDPSVELQAFSLIRDLPGNAIKVAESGVRPNRVCLVREKGYDAALVGTSLLKHPTGIEDALSEFERALLPQHEYASSPVIVPA
jgi:indole-3-glycerol phosphate synthase